MEKFNIKVRNKICQQKGDNSKEKNSQIKGKKAQVSKIQKKLEQSIKRRGQQRRLSSKGMAKCLKHKFSAMFKEGLSHSYPE